MPRRERGNLPAELTSFVGRRTELGDARRLLAKARLVTCAGPGGVGKTRLATRAAAEVRRAFPDGVWLVELAHLNEDQLVADAVSDAFGLVDDGGEPTSRLVDYLRDKHLLLVLDNCEHLVDTCSVLVAKLLAAAPDVRVLATSRQVLGVEGEHVLQVHPLSVPAADSVAAPADLLASEAVTLFADRVTAVIPEFELSDEILPTVHRICQRLDGMPLAIELAAARCRALGLEELEARLDDAFALLRSGRRAVEPRQRTLEAAIDWSHALCTPEERLLWARLSVFADSFGIEAAEEVGGGDGIAHADVFDVVTGLIDKSVLTRIEGSYGRQARFRMLETLRQYGQHQLARTGDVTAVRSRHVAYYRAAVRRAETEYFHPGEVASLASLRAEHGNIRAALEFCLAAPERIDDALDIAAQLRFYWVACGLLREGLLWLTRGLSYRSEATPIRARALVTCAYLYQLRGELTSAGQMLAEAKSLAERFGDERTLADVDWCAARDALHGSDIGAALTALDRALARFRSISDDLAVYRVQLMRALAALTEAPTQGLADLEEASQLVESARAGWSRGLALWLSSLYRLRERDVVAAADLARESVTVFNRTNDQRSVHRAVRLLGWCAAADRRFERSATLFGAADKLKQISGAASSYPHVRAVFGHYEDEARQALGVDRFDACVGKGAAMTAEDAVTYALSESAEATSTPHSVVPETAQLTRRETEIARLVGEGLTNKEIAARLVISQRTAEAHVEHILSKLGFRSRAQIAAWIGSVETLT